jgi:hypothetical protein
MEAKEPKQNVLKRTEKTKKKEKSKKPEKS